MITKIKYAKKRLGEGPARRSIHAINSRLGRLPKTCNFQPSTFNQVAWPKLFSKILGGGPKNVPPPVIQSAHECLVDQPRYRQSAFIQPFSIKNQKSKIPRPQNLDFRPLHLNSNQTL